MTPVADAQNKTTNTSVATVQPIAPLHWCHEHPPRLFQLSMCDITHNLNVSECTPWRTIVVFLRAFHTFDFVFLAFQKLSTMTDSKQLTFVGVMLESLSMLFNQIFCGGHHAQEKL